MTQISAALVAGVNVVSLLSLNYQDRITAWFDKATTSGDYSFYGSVDSTTTLATQNIEALGTVTVSAGMTEPQLIALNSLSGFPYLVIVAPDSATLYIEGGAAAGTPTLASVAAPAAATFTAIVDLTAFDLSFPVTVMASKEETESDGFIVYATQDVTATDADGCVLLGTITGGSGSGGNDLAHIDVKGWPYLLFYRRNDDTYTGTTAGTIKAAGVLPGSGIGIPVDVNPSASIAQRGTDGSGWFTAAKLSANGATVAAAGRIRLAVGAETILGFRNAGNTADVMVLSKDGAADITLGDATTGAVTNIVSGVASAINITSGSTGAISIDSGSTGAISIGTGASAKIVTLGNTSGATAINLRAGSGGVTMQATGPGNVAISTTGTGAVTIAGGTGASNFTAAAAGSLSLTVGAAGTLNLGTSPNAQSVNVGTGIGAVSLIVGSTTTTSSTSIYSGSTGMLLQSSGGGMSISSGTTMQIDCGSGSTLDIGIAGAPKTITVGNTNTTTAVNVNVGSGGMGINGASDASALLTLTSTTRGLLLPRMTTGERDAIAAPASGLLVYNTSTNKLNFRAAAAWEAVTSI